MQRLRICLVSVVQMFQMFNLYNDCQMQSHSDSMQSCLAKTFMSTRKSPTSKPYTMHISLCPPPTATAYHYHKIKYKLLDTFLLIICKPSSGSLRCCQHTMQNVFLYLKCVLTLAYVCCIQADQVLEWALIGLA